MTISSVADIFEPALLDEVRAAWDRTLGPFVPDLPEVEQVLTETRERLEVLLGPKQLGRSAPTDDSEMELGEGRGRR